MVKKIIILTLITQISGCVVQNTQIKPSIAHTVLSSTSKPINIPSPIIKTNPEPVTKLFFISENNLYLINADGNNLTKLGKLNDKDKEIDWSPDCNKITFIRDENGNPDVFVMNTDGTNLLRLTNTPEVESNPVWSPDGKEIAFISNNDIYLINEDGTNIKHINTDEDNPDEYVFVTEIKWSPDGKKISYVIDRHPSDVSTYGFIIYSVNTDGTDKTNLSKGYYDRFYSWSPDSTKIAYREDRGFGISITVINKDGSDKKSIAEIGGYEPGIRWSPDSKKIAFENSGINIINSDGSNKIELTVNGFPTWSPDGMKIALNRDNDIYIINIDGSNLIKITNDMKAENVKWIK